MSSLPMPPPTHPATTTGNIPTDSIGPLPPHLADIGTPQRQRSPVGATAYLGGSPRAGSPGGYSTGYQTTTHITTSPRYAAGSPSAPPAYVASASPGAGGAYTTVGSPGTGPTYEQEVQSFLDQTSPARIREQTQTKLPPADYMERANHESITNENSPARTGRGGSYSGSPSGVAYSGSPSGAPYAASPSAGYVQQTSYTATSYAPPPVAATYSQGGSPRAMSGSPGGYVTTTGTGPTYEQEVQSYLDQTSPARIREQTPTTLPPADYMNRAQHESVTNENSPARTGRGGGSYSGSPSGTAGGGFVGAEYVPIIAGSPPAQYSAGPAYVAPNTYTTTSYAASPATGYTPGSPGIDGGSQAPPAGPVIPGEGESPRRIRAFGVPHVDPNDPGNVAASQRRYS